MCLHFNSKTPRYVHSFTPFHAQSLKLIWSAIFDPIGSQHHMPHHLDDSDENTESESDESPEDKGSDDSDEKGYSDGQSSDSEHTSEHRR